MSQDAYRLVSPDGKEMELPVHSGTTGPDVIDIARPVSYTHLRAHETT